MPRLSRRTFLAALASPAPVRQITKGPGFHWFGYYDKLQFDPAGRYVLSSEVTFQGRSPLATPSAWNWQQGWMP